MVAQISRVHYEDLSDANLQIDTVYESKRGTGVNLGIEPLTKLIPGISLMGGIRKRINPKTKEEVGLVLLSTSKEVDWPDNLDIYSGIYTYYGDNRLPGQSLLSTPRGGNKTLEKIFKLASGNKNERLKCPIILAFENTGDAHDSRFLGLLVPGTSIQSKEDLVAVWAAKDGQRFQNYRARFTVLETREISGAWVREIFAFKPLNLADSRVPESLRLWIETGKYTSLKASPKKTNRTIVDQSPSNRIEKEIIKAILECTKHDPTMFEFVASEIWKLNYGKKVEISVTRKFVDGGRDAVGRLILGPKDDPIGVSFAIEAKAYGEGHNVGVKDIARLVSRIKHREFGVFITTSAVSNQAYKEVRDDGHPIIIFGGHDIAQTLIESGINSAERVKEWISGIDQSERI